MQDIVKKTVLKNGIRIVTEKVPEVRSVSLGLWLDVGSRDEDPMHAGIAHLVEHMLFKGTARYSALDIAMIFDQMGGMSNAFTSKETTCYYAKILDNHLEKALSILSELFLYPSFEEKELQMEREVVLQEIKMVFDTPEDYLYDAFGNLFWPENGLGRSVLGVPETIIPLQAAELKDFVHKFYAGKGLIISAAGNVDHKSFVEKTSALFSSFSRKNGFKNRSKPVSQRTVSIMPRDIEQAHILLGFDGPSSSSEDRHAAALFNVILGGSMSSRLFQEVREKRGLAYSIHSFVSSYHDAGLLGIAAAMSPEKVKDVVDIIFRELERLSKEKISWNDLESPKEHIKGGMLLALENTENRMTHLAKGEMIFKRHVPYRETMEGIDAVSPDDIKAFARHFLETGGSVAALGPIKESQLRNCEGFFKRKSEK